MSFVVLGSAAASAADRGRDHVEAYSAGEGFGVARVTLDIAPGASSSPLGDDRFTITGPPSQVLYPVMQGAGRIRQRLGGLLGIEAPRQVTFYFVFVGNQPLELTTFTPEASTLRVIPQSDQRKHRKLFEEWWNEYCHMYERVHRDAEYPVDVQTYLTALWSTRLGVEMPQLDGFLLRDQQKGGTWTGKTLGDESYRASVLRDLTLGRFTESELADHPLPTADTPPEPLATTDVVLEPIASAVPADCFYIRFGSYKNYSSTREFLDRWQGDLGNLLVLRSIHRDSGATVQRQLGLAETELSKMFGPSVIHDVAFIGLDPYLRDGAAFGILFEAKNSFLLNNSLTGQRNAAAKAFADAKVETVTIAGKQVSLVSTPGSELRSYYVSRDAYHLVCTSRAMVEKFLAAGQSEPSLAQSADFVQARAALPPAQNGTVFAHVSRAFWQQLTSPPIRIAFDRRLRALAEIEAITLARYTAAQEGVPARKVAELVEAGYLPAGFGQHADGGELGEAPSDDVAADLTAAFGELEGQLHDTHWGVPGRMSPVADSPATSATTGELKRYAEFRQMLATEVGELPPVSVELVRHDGADGGDAAGLVTIRARVGDYSRTQIASLAKRLGPATTQRVAPMAGDVIAGEVVLSDLLGNGTPIHAFAGLRNSPVPLDIHRGGLQIAGGLSEAIRVYVGMSPRPGFLGGWFGRPAGAPDGDGLARTGGIFQLWTHQAGDVFLFAIGRDVLLEVVPQFAMVDDEIPAQARLTIGEIVGSQVELAANAFGFSRSRQTSASGSRYMNALHRQLGVPKADCRVVAERLVAGEFVCPLGGQYELVEIPGGVQAWVSTAAAPNNQFILSEVPQNFELPLLTWFHGLNARLTQAPDDAMVIEINLASELPPAETQAEEDAAVPAKPPAAEELPRPSAHP